MFTHLKICGITNLQDALDVAHLGVTFLGFNFFPGSKRFIKPERAREIIKALPFTVRTVGILVKPTLKECQQIITQTGVDFLQIYQPQDFDDFELLNVPVIEAIRLKNDVPFVYKERNARYILIDAFDNQLFGGTGRPLDWQNIPADIPKEKLILAGGIKPENILQALNTVNPAVIDVASGSEYKPGKKDLAKVKALQKAVLTFNIYKMNGMKQDSFLEYC